MALSGGSDIARFYPVGGDQAPTAGFVQCFLSDIVSILRTILMRLHILLKLNTTRALTTRLYKEHRDISTQKVKLPLTPRRFYHKTTRK